MITPEQMHAACAAFLAEKPDNFSFGSGPACGQFMRMMRAALEAADAAAWRPISELPDDDDWRLFISDNGWVDYCAPCNRRTDVTRWRDVVVPAAASGGG